MHTTRLKIQRFAEALTEEHLNRIERDLFKCICDCFSGDKSICANTVAKRSGMSVQSFRRLASQLMTLGYLVGEEDRVAGITNYKVNPLILREDLRNFI